MYIHTRAHTCIHTYEHTVIDLCACVCMCVCARAHACVRACVSNPWWGVGPGRVARPAVIQLSRGGIRFGVAPNQPKRVMHSRKMPVATKWHAERTSLLAAQRQARVHRGAAARARGRARARACAGHLTWRRQRVGDGCAVRPSRGTSQPLSRARHGVREKDEAAPGMQTRGRQGRGLTQS